MKDNQHTFDNFLAEVKTSQTLWALQDKTSEDWVVLDSINFENTETMPVWSNAALAKAHCVDEWQDYIPAPISISDWFEFWIADLSEDGVMIGINWRDDDDSLELALDDLSQALADIELL